MYRFLIGCALCCLVARSGQAAEESKEDLAKRDLKKLEGTWMVVTAELYGNAIGRPEDKSALVIDGNKAIWMIRDEGGQTADIKLDASKTPKTIDFAITRGSDFRKTQLCIYELDGETLKICYGTPGDDKRPSEFTSKKKEGMGMSFAVYKRFKEPTPAGTADDPIKFKVGVIGGAAVAGDDTTLVVSVPASAELIYFDTLKDKELKRVELDFQPTTFAIQGKKLMVAAKGSATLHVLDLETAKEEKAIKVPGEPLQSVACHPEKGLVYVANFNNEVYAVDVPDGKAHKTPARGQQLAVDPVEGKYVYTGTQKPVKDQIFVDSGPNGKMKITFDRTGLRATLLKFEVNEKDLKLIDGNDNAVVGGRIMRLSPDGKKIAFVGEHWRSKTDPQRSYAVAVFNTEKMDEMLGQVETERYPYNVAFHPVLNLGVAQRISATPELVLFKAKSFAPIKSLFTNKAFVQDPPILLTFAAKGTKILFGRNSDNKTFIYLIPLELTDADREALNKVYEKK